MPEATMAWRRVKHATKFYVRIQPVTVVKFIAGSSLPVAVITFILVKLVTSA